ncbi:HAMP domain-containing sensor histidine kinase [Jeotgalibacillus sp. R-1-5s-1]|uniref:HAMP domain-containing sensor histidine kinase n=1 Tax=Jeotgalibacillus sp. R-1-5s-1 TaxID=2555897 RepID=UPI00106A0829|nr:HAMP domain-containing sensor histidine kinase [Jeotgalibacillus sp. R-1-5s-1]TFD94493.1 HAMP domain-containing histidine kinase [Jeotgalibacillus sp. R-1-5s-1]
MKRFFHTIYGRFLVIFIGLLLIPMMISFAVLFTVQLGQIREDVTAQIKDQAEVVQTLIESNTFTEEEALDLVVSDLLIAEVYSSAAEWRNSDTAVYTGQTIEQLTDGEVVTGVLADFRELPYAAFEQNGAIYMISPDLNNNQITQFREMTIYSFLGVAVVGSILLLFAISFLTKRLKRISQASRQVYEGNYSVRIEDKGNDEIGDLARQFNQMAKELESNEYLNKELSATMAHEFKTPVSSMIGFAALLKKEDLPENKRLEYASVIEREARRLANLSSALLKLSTFDHQLVRLEKETYMLDEQIRECLLTLQPQWEEKELQLNIELEEITLTADQELMSQVWLNILKNAIEHSNHGGELAVTLSHKPGEIQIMIKDQGKGIEPEHIGRIFDRFYQADQTRHSSGTGLGLPLVKKIVELHDGRVAVESKPGAGALFTVILPLSERP